MAKQLSHDDIRDLVIKAFIIEAITYKPGCTTRYEDVTGKPLQDFIHAGVNASRYFKFKSDTDDIFDEFPKALLASNIHKSSKYINFGLLEIMFSAVAARSQCDNPKNVVNYLIERMKNKSKKDVDSLLKSRHIAFGTSSKDYKSRFKDENYQSISSPYDFYMKWSMDFNEGTSNHQWALQYKSGLPILKSFFENYMSNDEYMKTTKTVFSEMIKLYPKVSLGIHADMCAAALFLYFSYTNE